MMTITTWPCCPEDKLSFGRSISGRSTVILNEKTTKRSTVRHLICESSMKDFMIETNNIFIMVIKLSKEIVHGHKVSTN